MESQDDNHRDECSDHQANKNCITAFLTRGPGETLTIFSPVDRYGNI